MSLVIVNLSKSLGSELVNDDWDVGRCCDCSVQEIVGEHACSITSLNTGIPLKLLSSVEGT